MEDFSTKNCIPASCKMLNQSDGTGSSNSVNKTDNQPTSVVKNGISQENPVQPKTLNTNVEAQTDSSSSHSNSSYASNHMVYNNCPNTASVNGGLPTAHYYPPILNTPQSLLRPLMTTQPPLYSPILPPQQHSYGLPHPSPSSGSFSGLPDSGRSLESLACSSESIFKDVNHHARVNGGDTSNSEKSCSMQISKQYGTDSNQKRPNQQNSCNLARFSSCAEAVGKGNNLHDQQQIFEDYVRIYGDDGSCRSWGDSCSSIQTSSLHKNNPYPSHQSSGSVNVHGFSDCRLDPSWNRYISGQQSGISDMYSVADNVSSPNPKQIIKSFAGANNSNPSLPLTPQTQEHNLSRSHYEYQAISAGQLASLLSYMQPVNYQQQPQDCRNECRVSDTTREDQNHCGLTNNEQATVHSAESLKKPIEPSTSHLASSSQDVTTTNNENNTSLSISSSQISNISSHTIQPVSSYTDVMNSVIKEIQPEKKGDDSSQNLNNTPSCSGASINKLNVKNSIERESNLNFNKKTDNKEMNGDEANLNNFCLLCGSSVEEASTHLLIDNLVTLPSKISITEKLAIMIGYPLPRDMLPSQCICPKCFHLINEVDVLEHRLNLWRREILLSIEGMFERNGIHFLPYKRFQRQQYVGSYQHHEMQYAAYQSLGSNVMSSHNLNNSHGSCQTDTQNYQTYPTHNHLNHGYLIHQNQGHLSQNYNLQNTNSLPNQTQIHNQDQSQQPSHNTTTTSQLTNHHHHTQDHTSHSQMQHQSNQVHDDSLKAHVHQGLNKINLNDDSLKHHHHHHHHHHHNHNPHTQSHRQQQHSQNKPSERPQQQPEQQQQQHQQQQQQQQHHHHHHNHHMDQQHSTAHTQSQQHHHQQQQQHIIDHLTITSNHSHHLHHHAVHHHSSNSGSVNQVHSMDRDSSQIQPGSDQQLAQTALMSFQTQQQANLSLTHQYQSTSQSLTHSSNQTQSTNGLSSSDNNVSQHQTLTDFHQNPVTSVEDIQTTESIAAKHSVVSEIQSKSDTSNSSILQEDMQKKKKDKNLQDQSLLLESTNQIPLILPESSGDLSSHQMSVLLSYQQAADGSLGSDLIVSNFDHSFANNASAINYSQNDKNLQKSENISEKDFSDVQNIDVESWNHCNNHGVDNLAVNSNPISSNHPECDIDIEKCDMIENVPNEPSNSVSSGEVFSEMKENKTVNVSQQSTKGYDSYASDLCSGVPKSDKITTVSSSSANDLDILLPPPFSPPPPPEGPPEGLRNVQDATEYHKPTLLGKNIKAKKHAKLQICRQCDQVFSNRQSLIRHIERRHKNFNLNYSCDTCHKKFNSERTLKQHIRSHKTYPCKVCSKIFLKKSKLKKHLEEHSQKSLTCKVCNKVTGSMQALISHLKTHERTPKSHVCSVCLKKFTCKRNLDFHSRIHSGEKPFTCENCNKVFRYRNNMVNHYILCTGKFRFVCATCGRGFVSQSQYKRHSAEHEGRFAHNCCVCNKGFGKSSDLIVHSNVHRDRQTCSKLCSVCGNGSGCNRKKRRETKNVCEICGKHINRKETMRDHLSFHAGQRNHACHLCSMSYYYRSNLTFHIKTIHLKKFSFSCSLCCKAFSKLSNYKVHMRMHTGEKPYQCKSCGKAFSSSSNYKRHLKCHVTHVQVDVNKNIEESEIL